MSQREEIAQWLASVTTDTGVDVSEYEDKFVEHGLTKFLLHDVSDDDWPELVEKIGDRITLRTAAKNVYLKAEEANLKEMCQRLQAARDQQVEKGQVDRATLERVSADLARVDGDYVKATTEFSAQQAQAAENAVTITDLKSQVEALKGEVDSLRADVKKVQSEKVAALKAKEEAIMRAVEFGVSGATRQAPVQPFQPQQSQPQSAPNGFGAVPQPQQQQQQQQQQQSFQQQPPQQQQFQQQQQPPQQQFQQQQFQPQAPQQQQQQQRQQPQFQQPPQQQQQFQQQPPPQQQQQFNQPENTYASQMPPPQQQQGGPPAPQKVDPSRPITSYQWYHGNVSREQCEATLMGQFSQIGDFMIRKSTRGQNSYSLSVKSNSGAKHFKIEKVGDAWKLALRNSDGKEFASIPHLINYYQANNPAGSTIIRPAQR